MVCKFGKSDEIGLELRVEREFQQSSTNWTTVYKHPVWTTHIELHRIQLRDLDVDTQTDTLRPYCMRSEHEHKH
jgi:hypothetical protein